MNNESRAFSNLGLAMKSGNLVSGEFMTEKAVKEGRATLVILATDSSGNTKKKFHNMCDYYEVPLLEFGTKEQIGWALGKEIRASLAILDNGFAKMIRQNMNL